MRPEQLYSSPFTDEVAAGPNAVFPEEATLLDLIQVLMHLFVIRIPVLLCGLENLLELLWRKIAWKAGGCKLFPGEGGRKEPRC